MRVQAFRVYGTGEGKIKPFMSFPTLLTPRQAAEKLGICYPALKHWILAGRIRTVKTPGGHHRIPGDALGEFLPSSGPPARSARISGRNRLLGTVAEIAVEGLMAKVVLSFGNQKVTAIITADAVPELGLRAAEARIDEEPGPACVRALTSCERKGESMPAASATAATAVSGSASTTTAMETATS